MAVSTHDLKTIVTGPNIVNKFDASSGYSPNLYDIGEATKNNIVYPSMDPSIFEVRFPDTDIEARIVGA